MRDATRKALNRLNQAFYAGPSADSFSATRSRPWAGWFELTDQLALGAAPRVLDVGCGNGRFAHFLARWRPAAVYLGLDLSEPLLAIAKAHCPLADARFQRADLVEETNVALTGGERFDLVVAFGLLHHIPGRACRHTLLRDLARTLQPGGALCASFWQPPPFRPERLEDPAQVGLDPAALEAGDTLLRWGQDGDAVRYVHLSDEAERAAACQATGLSLQHRWAGDPGRGDHNEYVILA